MAQPQVQYYPAPVANPAPLGLLAFGTTTLVLSLYNVGAAVGYGSPPNVIVGLALFYGGLAQLLAGMWEFRAVNTFLATAFTSYGAFWLSYATLLIPGFGIGSAYDLDPQAEENAIAIYLLGWSIFSFVMFLCTFRQSIAVMLLFAMLTITFFVLSLANFHPHIHKRCTKAGGYFGIITAAVAIYIALASLATKDHTVFTLPVGPLQKSE